jgi:hypothetical protein
MFRYGASTTQAVSGTAATNTFALGLVTGASKTAQIYEAIFGMNAAVADAQVLALLTGSSTALTTGTGITPAKLDSGNPATTATVSSLPTGATINAQPYVALAFNTRATVRWVAADPDSRIIIPAGGSTAGNFLLVNQQPGTVASLSLDHYVAWAE